MYFRLLPIVKLFWPKFIFHATREKIKASNDVVSVSSRRFEQSLGLERVFRPVRPWAFIRVKNEIRTIAASLESILPAIDRGVIGYNLAPSEEDDGTVAFVHDFCRVHPGFRPVCYPYEVEPAMSPRYQTGELAYENTLAAYYNAVLAEIPQGEWLIKIDVDQLYVPHILRHSFSLPRSKHDVVSYARLNLVRTPSGECRCLSYIRPYDHWLICNEGLSFENVAGTDEAGEYCAWEKLCIPFRTRRIQKPECSSLHFPFEKRWRAPDIAVESLPSFEAFMASADPEEFSEELFDLLPLVSQFDESR